MNISQPERGGNGENPEVVNQWFLPGPPMPQGCGNPRPCWLSAKMEEATHRQRKFLLSNPKSLPKSEVSERLSLRGAVARLAYSCGLIYGP